MSNNVHEQAECSTHISLLRHGECEGGHIFRGSTDVALSSQGFDNMLARCEAHDWPWQHVLSSPLQRCKRFAEHVAQDKSLSLSTDDDLREIYFGDWEGQDIANMWQENEQALLAWGQNPEAFTPPNGELLSDVAIRVNNAFAQMLQIHRGQQLLVLAHGGVIRVLLAHILGMPLSQIGRIDIPYASLSQLAIYHYPGREDVIKLLNLNSLGSVK
ncbi:MAG: histidine phosphatase family protein [Alteromonadaceae bacterium]|nr:MAG: histidine phosphatase family protein [Alteromonadaceae bacterium]